MTPTPINPISAKISISTILITLFLFSISFTRDLYAANFIVFALIGWAQIVKPKNLATIPPLLLITTLLATTYAILSIFPATPSAWTRLREIGAIPQQLLYAFFLPGAFLIYVKFFTKHLPLRTGRKKLLIYMLVMWIISTILQNTQTPQAIYKLLAIQGTSNTPALALLFFFIALSNTTNLGNKFFLLSTFSILSLSSEFSQNYFLLGAVLMLWAFPKHSVLITSLLVTLSIAFYSIIYIFNLTDTTALIDPNLRVRLVLLKDAFSGLVATDYIGVGFGTESIKNYYTDFDERYFYDESQPGFIHLAVHNSFATLFFRTGILGGFIFSAFSILMILQLSKVKHPSNKALACSCYISFFTVMFLNPALESFYYLNAVALYTATIYSLIKTRKQQEFTFCNINRAPHRAKSSSNSQSL